MLKKGYSVIEVLLAGSVFALAASGIVVAVMFAQRSNQASTLRERALIRAEEGLDAVRSIRDRDFANLINGTDMALSFSGGEWSLIQSPVATDDAADGLTRRITIENGLLEAKEVTVSVSYVVNADEDQSTVSLTEQLYDLAKQISTGVTAQSENYQLVEETSEAGGNVVQSVGPPAEVGEVGQFTSSNTSPNGTWETVSFVGNYTTPIVVGTANSSSDSEAGLVFEARNITSSSAEMRLCQTSDDNDICENHTNETAGYVVIDLDEIGAIDGIEAGTISLSGSTFQTVNMTKTFSATNYVFASIQELPGQDPVEAIVQNIASSSFDIGICHQSGDNGCDATYPATTVAWLALDSGNIPFDQTVELGAVSTTDDLWQSVSFTSAFAQAPVLIGEVSTSNGAEEVIVEEFRNITTSGMQARFCETEASNCGIHTAETVTFGAFDSGLLTITP